MTSILSNIGVNFSRKSAAKKAAANTNQTGGGGSHSPNCGAGGGGTYSPLGTSPTTNSLLSSFTSSNLSHQLQRQQETNNNSHCFTHKGESLQSDQHSTAGHHPQVANFNISSFPHSLVGALRGSANTTPGSESSPNESADELNCSGISSATMGLGFGGGTGGNHPAYLASCATLERTRRYQECKIMVQLPRGFDRLEWLAYHGLFCSLFIVFVFFHQNSCFEHSSLFFFLQVETVHNGEVGRGGGGGLGSWLILNHMTDVRVSNVREIFCA